MNKSDYLYIEGRVGMKEVIKVYQRCCVCMKWVFVYEYECRDDEEHIRFYDSFFYERGWNRVNEAWYCPKHSGRLKVGYD